jgi:hypothetical protein
MGSCKARIALALLLLLSPLLWTVAMAQDRNSDEELVRSLDDQERTAALNRDDSALERLWSEQFILNAPNNQVVVGKRGVLDTFIRAGIINFSTFERQIEFIRADGAFVIIMGLETVQPVSDAPSAGLVAGHEIKRRFTNIWKNEAGTWRLFVRHANVIPGH